MFWTVLILWLEAFPLKRGAHAGADVPGFGPQGGC